MSEEQPEYGMGQQSICLVCGVPEDMLEYIEESEECVKNS